MSNKYKHPLLGCLSDCRLSLLTLFCPCYTQGKNAQHFGEDCLTHGLLAMVGGPYFGPLCFGPLCFGPVIRWRLRQERGLEGSMLKDVLSYLCCPCCTAVQDAREIGWNVQEELAKDTDRAPEMARE